MGPPAPSLCHHQTSDRDMDERRLYNHTQHMDVELNLLYSITGKKKYQYKRLYYLNSEYDAGIERLVHLEHWSEGKRNNKKRDGINAAVLMSLNSESFLNFYFVVCSKQQSICYTPPH